jgi:hypothetical protein
MVAMSLLALSPARAEADVGEPAAVVELFTSQGCASCPKADALLAELAENGDVVALAYHVDYWDYLGWKDTLASAANSERQRSYNEALGHRSVYTPQIIVNGRRDVNGTKPAKVEAAIARMKGTDRGMVVDVSLRYGEESLVIDVSSSMVPAHEATVMIVYFDDATTVAIGEGENAGRKMLYVHPVTAFHGAGMWQGGSTRLKMPLHEVMKKGTGGAAVLVQSVSEDGRLGPILGAALLHHP